MSYNYFADEKQANVQLGLLRWTYARARKQNLWTTNTQNMEQLKETYRRQDTEELLELSGKELTEEARSALKQVLVERNVDLTQIQSAQSKAHEQRVAQAKAESFLAEPSARFVCVLIDWVIAVVVALVLFYPITFVSSALYETVAVLAFWVYFLIRDTSNRWSIGKRAMGIRVIDSRTGTECTLNQSFWRNLMHFFFVIDALFILGKKRMRLGDMLANTIVIKSS